MEDIPLITFGEGEPVLCRINDFATSRGISAQTLYSAESSGRIIGVRRNGKLYIQVKSAEEFLARHRALNPTTKET